MVGGSDVPTSSAPPPSSSSSGGDGGAVIISKPTRGNRRRGPALTTRLAILESASQAELGGSRRSVETSATASYSYTSSAEDVSSFSFSGTSSIGGGGGTSRGSTNLNCDNSNSSLADATPPPQPPSSLEAATCIAAPPRSSRRIISSSPSSARRPPPGQSSLLRTAAGGGAACRFKKSVSFSSSDDPKATTTTTTSTSSTTTAVREIIHEIEPVSEMSHDEINDIWYSETDLDDMQEDVADVLYLLREKEQADDEAEANDDDQNDQKANDQKANDQEEETTIETRGLEGMRTPLERLHLRQYRERTWDAVLDEQDRQWDEIDANDGQDEWGEAVPGSMLLDPDRLGEVARESTRRCVEIALELARGDAEFVQRMVQEDMVRSARVAREERVRNRNNEKADGDGGGDEEGFASRSAPTLPVQGLGDDDEQDEGASAASSSFNVPPPPTSTMPGPPPSAAAARRARRQISAGETTCSSSSAPTLGAGEGPGLTGFVVRTKRRPSAQGQQGSGPSLGGGGGGGPGRRSRPMLNRAGPGRPPSEQVRRGSIGNSISSGRPTSTGATNAAVPASHNIKSKSKSTPSRPNRRNRNDSAVLQDLRSARQMERYGESRRILAMGGSFRSAAPTDDDSDPYLISEAGGIGGGRGGGGGGGGSNNRTRRSPSTGRPASPRKIRKDKLKRGSTKPEYRKKYPNNNNGKDQQPLFTQPLSSDGTLISSSRQGGKQGMVKSLKAKMRRGHKKNGNYSSDDSLSLSEHDISERERLSAAATAMVSLIAEAADNDSEDRNGTYDFIPLQA